MTFTGACRFIVLPVWIPFVIENRQTRERDVKADVEAFVAKEK